MYLFAEKTEENYKKAVEIFEEAAKSKDKNIRLAALCYMGQMYETGKGYRLDFKNAKKCYMEAARENHGNSMFNLGRLYEKGLGVTIDENEAIKWYREAAKKHVNDAAKRLGDLYWEGKLVEKDDKEALKWYSKAAEYGNTGAMIRLFEIDGSVKWLEKAAERHDTEAHCKLGNMYMTGDKVSKDMDTAKNLYEKAAKLGNPEAQYNIGIIYLTGSGVKKDMATALYWLIKSGGQGNRKALLSITDLYYESNDSGYDLDNVLKEEIEKAEYSALQRELGIMYFNGSDKEDYAKAFNWLNLAVKHGDLAATCYLGVMYEQGKGTAKDPKRAFELLMEAAKEGYYKAQNYLGYMYENGTGINSDIAKAAEWYDKAAGHGYIPAILRLAEIYNNQGECINAIKLWSQAADLGDYFSQKRLIKIYQKTGDYDQLFNYRYKAALSGDPEEQYELALMFRNGQGIPMIYRNESKISGWLKKAAAQGYKEAVKELENLYQ